MADAELLYEWKNDKETIENSITKRGVTMEEHLKWLQGVIDNPQRQLYILEVDGVDVGQLRLDLSVLVNGNVAVGNGIREEIENVNENETESIAEISYGLGSKYRGKGLGKVLLEQAELQANEYEIGELIAEVLPHNVPSRKLFRKLGYEEEKRQDLYIYKKRICQKKIYEKEC